MSRATTHAEDQNADREGAHESDDGTAGQSSADDEAHDGGAGADSSAQASAVPEMVAAPEPRCSSRPPGAEWDGLWTKLSPHDRAAEGIELPGIGVIPAALALSMAGDLGVSITRMLIHPETGTVEKRATGYRPPAAIA